MLLLFMAGEIKELGGVRTHGSHNFKNSLASSRQGPEHGCSRPVMLTQQAGTLRRSLPASSLSLPSKAAHLNTPSQQVPKHSSGAPHSYQTPHAAKDGSIRNNPEQGYTGIPSQIWAGASAAFTSLSHMQK